MRVLINQSGGKEFKHTTIMEYGGRNLKRSAQVAFNKDYMFIQRCWRTSANQRGPWRPVAQGGWLLYPRREDASVDRDWLSSKSAYTPIPTRTVQKPFCQWTAMTWL